MTPASSETISFACDNQDTPAETAELATAASAALCGALMSYSSTLTMVTLWLLVPVPKAVERAVIAAR
jgi:hypothetical protein